MKTIPQVREELIKLANGNGVSAQASRKIKRLVTDMKRRKAVRRAATESAETTPALLARIRRFALANPNKSYKAIGNQFNVATGRVSEAVAGKRAA